MELLQLLRIGLMTEFRGTVIKIHIYVYKRM